MLQYHVLVSGKVQGVGFRYFVQMTAIKHQITGWVRNKSNGMVEILAHGSKNLLEPFMEEIKKGNRFAKVQDIEITIGEPEKLFSSFKVLA